MIAELYGKATGCAKGKGGSMHLIDTDAGMMGTSAVVGTSIANSVGYAYALKYRGSDAIVASFFGDGATEEGVFHESLNFAALKRLPVLFVCENNTLAIHSKLNVRQSWAGICGLAKVYGLPTQRFDDMNVHKIHDVEKTTIQRWRGSIADRFSSSACAIAGRSTSARAKIFSSVIGRKPKRNRGLPAIR